MTWRRDITDLVRFLSRHDTLVPLDQYWIENSEGGMEYGPDGNYTGAWCYEHGEDVVARLNLYTPGEDTYDLRWCDPCGIEDSIPACSTCGATLAGWPTEYCLSEEIQYFEDNPDFEPNRENLHVICMALWNFQWGEDSEDLFAWREIGRRTVDKIVFSPEFPRMTA